MKHNKYENNPDYRAKVDAQDALEENKEQERIDAIQKELHLYIEEDLRLEKTKK